ncbi:MAG: hypothetical protein FWG72_11060 [Oscillospiraceae bacterium]|nr:hypothetical protein [Oscillospiraceae bacterium]
MKRTTKILALTLALIMALALAACSDSGDNTSGGSTNTPPPSTPDTSTPSPNQTQGNGDNDPGTGDPGNGGGDDIPDNGTPPYVEPPLESHRGDKGYFYTTTDDYIVCISPYTSNVFYRNEIPAVYWVISFLEDGSVGSEQLKYVFETTADADTNSKRLPGAFIQIDNALYPNPNPPADAPVTMSEHHPSWVGGKDEIISHVQNFSIDNKSWVYYISKP